MEDKDSGFLDLSLTCKRYAQSVIVHKPVQEFVQSVSSVLDQFVSDQEQNPKSMPIYDSFRFPQVSSREKTVSDPTQVQESNLSPTIRHGKSPISITYTIH